LIVGLAMTLVGCGGDSDPAGPSGPPLSQLALFPHRLVLKVGESVEFEVTALDLNGLEVPGVRPTYTSTNTTVATVGSDGRINAQAVGTTTVRGTSGGQTAQATLYVGAATYDLATLGPPRILSANYIDLSKIERISRFRSTVGHSYTDGSETCRSMKHYFQPKGTVDWTDVEIYSPVAGSIKGIAPDGGFGSRVAIRPRDVPMLEIQIFHVILAPQIVPGTWLEAGQRIGTHASGNTYSDIAMSIGPKEGGTLVSYFDTMTDAVFAQYQARGVATRQAAVITEAERNADPVPCVGEQQFTVHGTLPDWLTLN
jgi:hypothetical protein